MNSKHKALNKKMTDSNKALVHHQNLASKEKEKNKGYVKKFGTFEERFKKFSKWKDNL